MSVILSFCPSPPLHPLISRGMSKSSTLYLGMGQKSKVLDDPKWKVDDNNDNNKDDNIKEDDNDNIIFFY